MTVQITKEELKSLIYSAIRAGEMIGYIEHDEEIMDYQEKLDIYERYGIQEWLNKC